MKSNIKSNGESIASPRYKDEILLQMAQDLTVYLSSPDPYHRFLTLLKKAIPFDAAAFMSAEGDVLVPQATLGLSEEAIMRRYTIDKHPRLEAICKSGSPVQFPSDSQLPDPFDGFLFSSFPLHSTLHSCLGIPLRSEGELIGVLTADSLDAHIFDELEEEFLLMIGALAGNLLQSRMLLDTIRSQAEKQGKVVEDLMKDAQDREGGSLVGTSEVMITLKEEISIVSNTDLAVLILGETGVGKERVARSIHQSSSRAKEAMIYVNCAALPESIAESELFGHSKGAFTGSDGSRSGKFEVADGGTLFLDEVGELPLSVQSKLLRVLQEGEIQRVGSDKVFHVNVRIIAATNRNLDAEVVSGRFRSDLYHRLHVYPITVPPLRDRGDDILLLAAYFMDKFRVQFGLKALRMDADSRRLLMEYDWPGNVRELGNIISRGILKASAKSKGSDMPSILSPDVLPMEFESKPVLVPEESPKLTVEQVDEIETGSLIAGRESGLEYITGHEHSPYEGLHLNDACNKFKKDMIDYTVTKHQGNWSLAAKELGLHRSNLHQTAVRLGLK